MSRPIGAKNTPAECVVMSFDEIGRRLGISRKAAWIYYRSGMRKIRNRPDSLRALQQTVVFRQQLEARRMAGGIGVEQ